MCRFLSLEFEYNLKCPVDRANHTVRFQAFPQLRGHALDVVRSGPRRTTKQSFDQSPRPHNPISLTRGLVHLVHSRFIQVLGLGISTLNPFAKLRAGFERGTLHALLLLPRHHRRT
jgi:hypothetical protein